MNDPGGMPMKQMSPWALARPIALAESVLALSYGIVVIADLAPLRLLDPAWLSRFCRTLSGWAFLPLIGTVLVHVAAMLDPDDEGLQRRQRRFRRAGVAACLGLLLLIPVQVVAVLRAVELSSIRASEARQSAQLRFTRLRQITMAASSTNALVEGLVALQGPVLPSAALQMPLVQLRRQVLVELRLAEREVQARLNDLARERALLPGLADLARVACLALLSALGLAGFAQPSDRSPSLLEVLQRRLGLRPSPSWQERENAYLHELSLKDWEESQAPLGDDELDRAGKHR